MSVNQLIKILQNNCARPVANNPQTQQNLNNLVQTTTATGKALEKVVGMAYEYAVNNILSGPLTHVGNMAFNTGVYAYRFAETASKIPMAAAWAKMGGDDYTAMYRAQLAGEIFSQVNAVREAFKVATTLGEPVDRALQRLNMPEELARTNKLGLEHRSWQVQSNSMLGSIFNMIGDVVNFPTTVLNREDIFFKILNYRAEQYKGVAERAFEIYRRNPTTDLRQLIGALTTTQSRGAQKKAIASAEERTFTDKIPNSSFLSVGEKLARQHPIIRPILMFVRAPVRSFQFNLDRMPVLGLLTPRNVDSMKSSAVSGNAKEMIDTLGRVAPSTAITAAAAATFAYMWDEFGLDIEGPGPRNGQQRALWQSDGTKEWTVTIGKNSSSPKRIPIKALSVMEIPFRLMALWKTHMLNVDLEDEDGNRQYETGASMVIGAMMNYASSATWVDSALTFSAAIDDINRRDDWSRFKMWSNQLGAAAAVPDSGMLAFLTKTMDSSIKDIRSFEDAVKAKVPWLAEELAVKRDMYGDPLHYENDMRKILEFFNPELRGKFYNIFGEQLDFTGPVGADTASFAYTISSDRVDKELKAMNFQVMRMRRRIQYVDLTQKEYELFQLYAAKPPNAPPLKETLAKIMSSPNYKNWSEARRIATVRYNVSNYRKNAKSLLYKDKTIDFKRRVDEDMKARKLNMTPDEYFEREVPQ